MAYERTSPIGFVVMVLGTSALGLELIGMCHTINASVLGSVKTNILLSHRWSSKMIKLGLLKIDM